VLSFDVAEGRALAISFAMETTAGAPRAALDFVVATALPEPRAVALLALGALALAARRRPPRRAGASPRG
jgi:hypothetical protein